MKNKSFLLSKCLLATTLLLSSSNLFSDVVIDGDVSEWEMLEQINLPIDLPPYLYHGDKVYGKHVTSPQNAYVFAIKTTGTQIGANTTFWLNTDNDVNTGFKVWGSYGGAEFFVNINSGDNLPYLYDKDGAFVTGPLEHSYSANGDIIEIVVPDSYIGDPQNGIGVIGDINDQTFFPENYALGELKVSNEALNLPPRTDFSKRVGIVYSQTSKNYFYDATLPIQKAYSQLFMTMQHHAMMAGVPFDLLNEDDLTDISKLVNYDALIFPDFAYVPSDKLDQIHQTLYYATYHYGIGIITAGDWMTNGSDGNSIDGDAYRNMKQMLGIGRVTGEGPVSIDLKAYDVNHPAMKEYQSNETIFQYAGNRWYSYFAPASSGSDVQPINVLAKQTVTGNAPGTYNAVIADQTGGRNVHFSSLEFMGDTNLLWSALQWSVFGNDDPVALKMGRYNNLFVSRNDMDQSQEIDEVVDNDGALLNLLQDWKSQYNFLGSYYINIGNNPPDQQTDWAYSGPLYQQYIALGNEIGTHSYTHPHNTNELSSQEIEFEFNQSMNIIASKLNPTWRGQDIRGGAVPGAPEGVNTANSIIQYLDYLTGGYSSVGAGYPGAFGYLTPDSNKVYLSPNMSFDFTLIEFGVPVWDEATGKYVPHPLTTAEAEQYWQDEYHSLTKHASQPIIHWPWHDYGPTTGATSGLYSESMFTSTIATAAADNAEFLTGIDLAQRIETFKSTKIDIGYGTDTLYVNVDAQEVGKFALDLQTDKKIKSIDNWYAYSDTKIFLDQDGGDYVVHLGTSTDAKTHITKLPMRANLLTLNGNGSNLTFTFEGEGSLFVALAKNQNKYNISGADNIKKGRKAKKSKKDKKKKKNKKSKSTTNIVELIFSNYDVHTVTIEEK